MYPKICQIGPFTIYSYGLMLALAFIICAGLASSRAKEKNMNPEVIFNLAFLVLVSGIIGARIFYVLENIGYYLKNPLEIILLQHGGLSWFGGLILGVSSAALFLRAKKLSTYKVLDLLVPFVALAQAIGRIGCLLNGCCYGKISPTGIYFPALDSIRVPTQLYSSLLLVLIFIILRLLEDRPHKEGQIFYSYLVLYSLKRFFIEFWRADNPTVFLGLTLFQIISILIFCIAVYKLFLAKKPFTQKIK